MNADNIFKESISSSIDFLSRYIKKHPSSEFLSDIKKGIKNLRSLS